MILKKHIKAFLSKHRDDHERYKSYSAKKLNRLAQQLPFKPPVWKRLRRAQKICFLLGVKYQGFAFFADTGVGKTLLSIALLRYFRRAGLVKKALVVVPNNINLYEWEDEILKHSPNTTYTLLDGPVEKKWHALQNDDSFIFVVSLGALSHIGTSRRKPETKAEKKRSSKQVMGFDQKKVNKLARMFNALVLDESSELGGMQTNEYRICRKVAKSAEVRFALSATPFGSDPKPLWSQMLLIDRGESLGETLGLFREAFYTSRQNFFSGFPEWTFDKRKTGKLHRILRHRSIYFDADSSDLPRVNSIIKPVHLPVDAETYYKRAKDQLIASRGNFQEMKNSFLRMRQISSGFLGFRDDEIGEKAKFVFPYNPKLEMLISYLKEVVGKHKAVVFNEFTFSGDQIAQRLKKEKIPFARIYGGTKDTKKELAAFKNDSKCRVILVQNNCGGRGLNLQMARYILYYESPTAPDLRKQTRRRVERQGSTFKSVFMVDFIVSGTHDRDIVESCMRGEDFIDQVMKGRRNNFL